MSEFSLQLNEDQLQIQKWIHDFAEGTIRPAAPEWDEREEFPWPVVEEAAEIGLYSTDFLLNAMGDPTGITLPMAVEEIFWGDAGIGMAIMGSALAAAGIAGNGTPEQMMEWVPQCYENAETGKLALGAFCASEPDAGSDVGALTAKAEPADDGTWRISGQKIYITWGEHDVADRSGLLVLAEAADHLSALGTGVIRHEDAAVHLNHCKCLLG